jgi:hypothetical protein
VYGPFFFKEKKRTEHGITYLGMLCECLMAQLQEDNDDFILVQDGAPPPWHLEVRNYLNEKLPRRWIGNSTSQNMAPTCWPPRSPDLTACDCLLWRYIKDRVYLPPLPSSIDDLKQRIAVAAATVDMGMLRSVWEELDYLIDICRVTKASHIEHM